MKIAISANAISRTRARKLKNLRTAASRAPHVDDLHAAIARPVGRIRLVVLRLGRADAGPLESRRVGAPLLQQIHDADGALAGQLEVVLEAQRLDRLTVGMP